MSSSGTAGSIYQWGAKVALESRPIEDYVTQEFVAVAPETSLVEVKTRLVDAARTEAYVVDTNGIYRGSVMLVQLTMLENTENLGASLEGPATQHAERDAIVLTGCTSIWSAMEQMPSFVGEDTVCYRLLVQSIRPLWTYLVGVNKYYILDRSMSSFTTGTNNTTGSNERA